MVPLQDLHSSMSRCIAIAFMPAGVINAIVANIRTSGRQWLRSSE